MTRRATCSRSCVGARTARRWPASPTSRGARTRATASACRSPANGARSSTPTPTSTQAAASATWASYMPRQRAGTGSRRARPFAYRRSACSGSPPRLAALVECDVLGDIAHVFRRERRSQHDLEQGVGEGAAACGEPRVLRVEQVEQGDKTLTCFVALRTEGTANELDETRDGVLDATADHVEIRNRGLRLDVVWSLVSARAKCRLVDALGPQEELDLAERGLCHLV